MSRKLEILEVALEIFAKNSYYGTSLEVISSRVGIKNQAYTVILIIKMKYTNYV